MGPKHSTNNNEGQYSSLLKNYEIIKDVDAEGLHYLRENSTGEDYLLRQFTFNDKKQYEKYLEILQKRNKQLAGCKYLIPLQKIFTRSEDQYCSTFYKIYALFKWCQRSLNDQILERLSQKRRFQEKQLWSILASCILGMAHLQKQGIKHQTLTSQAILISEDGNLQVYDPIATGNQNNLDILISNRSTPHIYLSPQIAQSLQKQMNKAHSNPYKSDIWTMGIIMLQAGLGQYQDECYRDQGSKIHWETLDFSLHRFRQIYSEDLCLFVEYMLSRQQRNRPDWIELEERVIKDQESRITSQHQSFARNNPYRSSNDRPSDSFARVSEHSRPTESIIKYSDEPRYTDAIPTKRISSNDTNFAQNYKYTQKIDQPFNHTFNQESKTSAKNGQINSNASIPIHTEIPQNHTVLTRPVVNKFQKPILIRQPLVQSQVSPQVFSSFSRPSSIESTRPLRNIFPTPIYQTITEVDENLIIVAEQERFTDVEDTPNNQRFNSSYFQTFAPSDQQAHSAPLQTHQATPYQTGQIQKHKDSSKQEAKAGGVGKNISVFQPPTLNQGEYVVQKYKQGSEYKGYKWQGMRHGFGVFYYQDGGMYEGEWKHNKMEGKGKLYYQSGKLAYEGEWFNDQFSGHGVLFNQYPQVVHHPINYRNLDEIDEMWTKYEGQFKQDLKEGKGTLYLTNGQYLTCTFSQDFAEGKGFYYALNGQKIIGEWSKNILID